MPWDWETFPEFLYSVERTPKGVNIPFYFPLAPLMTHCMGLDNAKNRPATAAEMKDMQQLLREGMCVFVRTVCTVSKPVPSSRASKRRLE